MKATPPHLPQPSDLAAELLELFYPIHYKGGMALEEEMQSEQLTRKQVAILWLIRSEGEQGGKMRRKDIEQLLGTWFEVSSATITKALQGMTRPPLDLVRLIEDPRSGREKQVSLTPHGERFLSAMIVEGQTFLQTIVEQLPEKEVKDGIQFLRKAVDIFERLRPQRMARGRKFRR